MIDYIKYTVDGKTYELINNNDGTWSRSVNAPSVVGLYNLLLEIGQGDSIVFIDSSDSRYNFYLQVIEEIERNVNLIRYLPPILQDVLEFNVIFDAENIELDYFYDSVKRVGLDAFIRTASAKKITRLENFLRFKGLGTLEQRRTYLLSLYRKDWKLNEGNIKQIVNTITGSECFVAFYGSDEANNPQQGYGLLLVQVLSPENNKDYRYEDIFRALRPLVPGHLKLIVVKYFATWNDVKTNFADWKAIRNLSSWNDVKNYIPPQ